MESVLKCAFSLLLFALYYYLFARRYVDKYRQGGVIKTDHEEKPANITPPGIEIHIFGFDRSQRKGNLVCLCVRASISSKEH